jgi:hypothetical protein
MFLVIASAVVGGIAALTFLWPYGGVAAVAAAPLGGSLLATMTAGFLGLRRRLDDLRGAELNESILQLKKISEDAGRHANVGAPATVVGPHCRRVG